jgi:hypothetical protein
MKLNVVIFSYNRLNGLLNILEQALIHSKLLSRVIVITNGDYPSRFEMNKFPPEVEIIVLAKKGNFDSSVLYFYDIARNWDGYTFVCGDDDLPNFPVLYYAVNEGLAPYGVNALPDVIGFNQPERTTLGMQGCNDAAAVSLMNSLINKPVSYNEMLVYFIFSLPLGSFLISNEKINNCSRDILVDSVGTWHTYSIMAFEMAFTSAKRSADAKPFLWMHLTSPIVLPQDRKWEKTYGLNQELLKSLRRTLDFLNLSLLPPQTQEAFISNYQQVVGAWVE